MLRLLRYRQAVRTLVEASETRQAGSPVHARLRASCPSSARMKPGACPASGPANSLLQTVLPRPPPYAVPDRRDHSFDRRYGVHSCGSRSQQQRFSKGRSASAQAVRPRTAARILQPLLEGPGIELRGIQLAHDRATMPERRCASGASSCGSTRKQRRAFRPFARCTGDFHQRPYARINGRLGPCPRPFAYRSSPSGDPTSSWSRPLLGATRA